MSLIKTFFVGNSLFKPISCINSSIKSQINLQYQQVRTVIYYDRNTGNRLNDQDAVDRFYRLYSGVWIRVKAGRNKKIWKKPWNVKWYSKQHMFCTEEMCNELEKMITADIKKERHFIDDIYAPYHKRHGMENCSFGKNFTQKSYIKCINDY